MKISIAMCTHNGASYVREQLDSIALQTRLPDELIICDDQSNDDTRGIVKRFASQSLFPVRLYVNKKTLGSTKNFERAINFCEGGVIALSDQDDVWHPEKLRRIESIFSSRSEVGLVFTDAEVTDESLHLLGRRLWQYTFSKRDQLSFKNGKAFDVLSRYNVVTGATMAFRSKFKGLVLPIPEHISAIHDGWIAALIAAIADVIFLPEPLIKYRQHGSQQIGVPRLRGSHKRKSTAELSPLIRRDYCYSSDIHQLKAIQERLIKYRAFGCNKNIESLEQRALHYQMRANIPDKRFERIPLVFKELFSLRYHKYSKGAVSFAKDLIL